MTDTNTKSQVVRFLFDNHGVRGEICSLHDSCRKLIENHNYTKPIKKLMLDLACAAVMIGATLKSDDQVMVQIKGGKGDHAIKFAMININKDMSFFGSCATVEGNSYSDNLSFKDLIGEGGILIISVFPKNEKMWQGVVELNKDNIALALEDYFKTSEQLATRFFIFTDENKLEASAIMLQIIPEIEGNNESLAHLATLTETMTHEEMSTLPYLEVLHRLYWNEKTRVFDPVEVKFKCICSKERCKNSLQVLPHADLEDIVQKEDGLTMTCQHCNKSYHFTKDELQKILLEVSQ